MAAGLSEQEVATLLALLERAADACSATFKRQRERLGAVGSRHGVHAGITGRGETLDAFWPTNLSLAERHRTQQRIVHGMMRVARELGPPRMGAYRRAEDSLWGNPTRTAAAHLKSWRTAPPKDAVAGAEGQAPRRACPHCETLELHRRTFVRGVGAAAEHRTFSRCPLCGLVLEIGDQRAAASSVVAETVRTEAEAQEARRRPYFDRQRNEWYRPAHSGSDLLLTDPDDTSGPAASVRWDTACWACLHRTPHSTAFHEAQVMKKGYRAHSSDEASTSTATAD